MSHKMRGEGKPFFLFGGCLQHKGIALLITLLIFVWTQLVTASILAKTGQEVDEQFHTNCSKVCTHKNLEKFS